MHTEVTRVFTAFVLERIDLGTTAADELRAFLSANLRFLSEHRAHTMALHAVRAHLSTADGDGDRAKCADLLREGQRAGEFRASTPT